MQLESYFDFVNDCAIRIKGHRIGIEHELERCRKTLLAQAPALKISE